MNANKEINAPIMTKNATIPTEVIFATVDQVTGNGHYKDSRSLQKLTISRQQQEKKIIKILKQVASFLKKQQQ